MVEFNPDGSIKLIGRLGEQANAVKRDLETRRCIKVTKEVVSFSAPKKCVLHITVSDAITDDRFIDSIYKQFKEQATTPTSITKDDAKSIKIDIGSDFKRCSECTKLIEQYRDFLDGNLILKKGNCTYEGRTRKFCFEDHFE